MNGQIGKRVTPTNATAGAYMTTAIQNSVLIRNIAAPIFRKTRLSNRFSIYRQTEVKCSLQKTGTKKIAHRMNVIEPDRQSTAISRPAIFYRSFNRLQNYYQPRSQISAGIANRLIPDMNVVNSDSVTGSIGSFLPPIRKLFVLSASFIFDPVRLRVERCGAMP